PCAPRIPRAAVAAADDLNPGVLGGACPPPRAGLSGRLDRCGHDGSAGAGEEGGDGRGRLPETINRNRAAGPHPTASDTSPPVNLTEPVGGQSHRLWGPTRCCFRGRRVRGQGRVEHATHPRLTADDIPRLLWFSLGLAAVRSPSRGRAKGGIAMAALKVGAVKAAALCLSLGAVLTVVAPAAARDCRAGCGLQKKACRQPARVTALACKQECRATVAAASLGACKRACMDQFVSATDACNSSHDDCLGSCVPPPPPGSCTGAFLDSCGQDLAACAQ